MLMLTSMHLRIWEVNFRWNRMACISMGSLVWFREKMLQKTVKLIKQFSVKTLNYGVPRVGFIQEKWYRNIIGLFKKLERRIYRGLKTRCQSRRIQAYLLSQNHQKHNYLLNNHDKKTRTYQKDILYPKTKRKPQDGRRGTFSSVQSLSRVWFFVTPWITACHASLSISNSRSLLKLMPIKSVMPSSHLILCHPLLLLSLIPPSIRDFSNESTLRMRCPKSWSFSFSINISNEHPGLISFRLDWLDLLAVQGTLISDLIKSHTHLVDDPQTRK